MERGGPAQGLMSAIRWILIVVAVTLAAYRAVSTTAAIVRWDLGEAGYSQHWPELVIRAVRPGYPAERAGLQPGDVIDVARLSLHDRLTVLDYRNALAGETARLSVVRGGKHVVVDVRNQPLARDPKLVAVALIAASTSILLAVLVVFVLLRNPTIEAFALWSFALGWIMPDNWQVGYLLGDWADALWSGCATDVIAGFTAAGMIVLALRATGRWPHRQRYEIAAVVVGVAVYFTTQYADVLTLVFGIVPSPLTADFASRAWIAPVLFSTTIVALAFLRARGPSRIRLRWVAIAFGCMFAGWLLTLIFTSIPALDFMIWPNFVNYFFADAGFATLAFAILRRDLFDVNFVVNRAAIYTTLTAVLIGAFAGLNWSIGLLLKQTGLALPIDVILAAAVGLSLNVIQRRVDQNVDKVFFRRRYDAEQRLRRVARALAHVTDNESVAQALVVEPVEALGLHAAAFYRTAPNGPFELIAARGWPPGSPTAVAHNDPMILHLGGVTEALRLESVPHDAAFPHGAARPRIAFPMWSRRELVGFVLYSTHQNGAMLDPDEVELIERIAAASVTALERVAAMSLQDRYATLRTEFESLKAQRDEFLSMLTGAQPVVQRAIASDSL
jgi:hypothetical protein